MISAQQRLPAANQEFWSIYCEIYFLLLYLWILITIKT
jgi:hypothetical protein